MDRRGCILVEEIGSHFIDMSLVPKDSVVISCGIGRDVSFDFHMMLHKNCFVVGIDPTNLSEKFINNIKDELFISNFKFICLAVAQMVSNIVS